MINPETQEDKTIRIKRLIYQSWHRGCKETDIALGDYAKAEIEGLSPSDLDLYEKLLDVNDWDTWEWITEKTAPPAEFTPIIAKIKTFLQQNI